MIGHLERDHVRELVPQRAAPVELARVARRRAVHRDHLSEANSERAQSRQPQRAHGKVFVIRKDLNRDRRARREMILSGELLVRFFDEVRGVDGKRSVFLWLGLDEKRTANGIDIILHRVEQIERVLGPHVERIALEGSLEFRSAFVDLANTQQLDSELSSRAPKIWRQLERAAAKVYGISVAPIVHG